MRATVDPKLFADAVAWLNKQRRPTSVKGEQRRLGAGGNAVLAGIHLVAEKERLVLQATDYDTWATATVEAGVHEPGAVTLPAELIGGVAKSLPRQPVSLALDDTTVTLTCGSMTLHAHTVSGAEWPKSAPLPELLGKLAAEDLRTAVARVAPGLGAPEEHPPFRSFGLETADALTLAATDRRRLAITDLSWEPVLGHDAQAGVLLPAHLTTIAQSLPTIGDVALHLDPVRPGALGGQRFGLSWPGRTVVTSTVVGAAPPYARTLGLAKPVISAEVDREELLNALKRVVPAAERDEVNAVLLDLAFTPGALDLAVASAAGRAHEQVEAEYDGPEIPLHLNARYLYAALEATGGERVHIGLATEDTNPRKHVTLLVTTPEDPNYQHVLTLIRRAAAMPQRAAA